MSESPLARLSRVLGGVALSHGSLAHQVLGQLLVMNSKEVEVAAASVVLAACSRQKDAALQASLRTLVPAIAIHLITRRTENRLRKLSQLIDQRELEVSARESALAGPRGRRGAP